MKTRKIEINPVRTYATRENAEKAVQKAFEKWNSTQFHITPLRYFIMTHTDGRFFPVFIGMAAINEDVHFKFNVVA